jgi:hypothetical protein
MFISEGDRLELNAILTMVICSNLKIIDPQLVQHVEHARDLLTTEEDRARFAAMKARLAEVRAGGSHD